MQFDDLAERVAAGRVPAGIYSDPGVFARERDTVFAKSWQFLAHESELPHPGDFVVRRILDDSFLVVRGDDRKVRVLLNMCRHRGMQVCRAEAGNAARFRCPYHAWTYRNTGELAALPFQDDAYGAAAPEKKADLGLRPAPQVATHRGLIFASLDPAAPDLLDTLGGYEFYLDFYLGQSAEGVEVHGPQRWRIHANWKIGAENFAGDSYHTPHTHVSVVEIGLFREPKASRRRQGALYWAGSGGGTTYKLPVDDFDENLAYIGYPPEMVERMRSRWSPAQRDMAGRAGFMVSASTLFPNLSFVHNWPSVHEGDDVVPFISMRQWQPVSATETEVLSWFLVDRNAPEQFKRDSYKAYLMCFGSSGMFEQDDVENWTSITSVTKGRFAATVELDSSMGLDPAGVPLKPPVEGWPGPGRAYTGFGEYNQRSWLTRWADLVSGAPERPEPGVVVPLPPAASGTSR